MSAVQKLRKMLLTHAACEYHRCRNILRFPQTAGQPRRIERANADVGNRKRTPLITYNQYRKEKKKTHKENAFHVDNWVYRGVEDAYLCPNGRKVRFSYHSKRMDKYGFTREFKVYECEDCSACPLRGLCTKAKPGNNRKVLINEKWKSQKEYVRTKLSDEKTGDIYGKRKIDVEPVFRFLKANLGFTRFSVRRKQKVTNELAFALMAVNLRKFIANNSKNLHVDDKFLTKKNPSLILVAWILFTYYFRLVISQPLFVYIPN